MSPAGIIEYSLRAGVFALIITGIAAAILLNGRKRGKREKTANTVLKLVFIFFLASLIQITVIRDWGEFFSFMNKPHTAATIQLIPLHTTIGEWHKGAWKFIYHVLGNTAWFVPLGLLLPQISGKLKRLRFVIPAAACLSAMIEILQWVFATGASDVDDVLLNTIGAAVGWLVWKTLISSRVKSSK